MNDGEMFEACGTHWEQQGIHGFGGETTRKDTTWPGVDARIILKRILQK
jgi:hypothetical protein